MTVSDILKTILYRLLSNWHVGTGVEFAEMEIIASKNLGALRVAKGGDKVYKDECVYCYDTPVSSQSQGKVQLEQVDGPLTVDATSVLAGIIMLGKRRRFVREFDVFSGPVQEPPGASLEQD